MRTASRFTLALFCCFSFPGFAQRSASPPLVAPPADDAALLRGPVVRRISLDVVVTDKSGNPVPGLQQQDFTVLDDKQPQKLLSFRASDQTSQAPDSPLQAILLVDAVNIGFQGAGLQRQALEKFLRQSGGQLPIPISLVLFSDTSLDRTEATRDGNALADSLNSSQAGLRTTGRSQGFYGGVDRLQISLQRLEELISFEATQPGRKLLVWLSAGWPLFSGPNVQLTAKNREWIFQTVVRLSTSLREARITLYSVDPLGMADAGSFRTFFYGAFLKGVGSANDVHSGNIGLQVVAAQSGGRVLNSSNDIAKSIAGCLADAKAFYTLSFDAPAADHPDEYHSLQVKIAKPGFTARTRTGYYAQR